VGRLIRDQDDFGVIVLCDRRITTRSYGRLFLSSLPPMPRTDELHRVCEFLRRHLQEDAEAMRDDAAEVVRRIQ